MRLSANARKLLEARYLKGGETPEEMFRRVAKAVASCEKEQKVFEELFYEAMINLRFLPNSPTLMNAGRPLGMLSACFVLPVGDSIEEIFDAIKNTALVQRAGGGTGFNFSDLRPRGSLVASSGGTTTGPCEFLKVFSQATTAIQQGAFRRGANMGVMDISHPDILEFINIKNDLSALSNFNLSVGVSDYFMRMLKKHPKKPMRVYHPKTGKGTLGAKWTYQKVWDVICESAWRTGEPGVLFMDEIERGNATPSLGKMRCVNPCVIGTTRILTPDGPKLIRECVERETTVWNGEEWSEVRPFWTGKNPLCRVRIGPTNEIICTPWHEFIIGPERMRVKAEELKPGMILSKFPGSNTRADGLPIIVSIDTVGWLEDTFCFTEPKANRGTFNGVVTGNCGERPLLPFEACSLASINLSRFVSYGKVCLDEMESAVRLATRFLDDLVSVNKYPIPEIEKQCLKTRRIGLGIMGFADMLVKLGTPYNSGEAVATAELVMKHINTVAHDESALLGKEKGFCPARDVKGRRNADLTTIAPTGSLSIIANCSGGVEPPFSLVYNRHVINSILPECSPLFKQALRDRGLLSDDILYQAAQEGSIQGINLPDDLKALFQTARDIPPEQHLRIQAAFQKHTDAAVSKTINLPPFAAVEDVRKIYSLAYDLGAKGVTVYRDGCRAGQPMALPKCSDGSCSL